MPSLYQTFTRIIIANFCNHSFSTIRLKKWLLLLKIEKVLEKPNCYNNFSNTFVPDIRVSMNLDGEEIQVVFITIKSDIWPIWI